MKILCLHIAENQASYRYRVKQFLPHWQEYGIEMHPVNIIGKNYIEKIAIALESRKYDYVWLQRKPLAPFLVSMIANRSMLLYDFDDALYAPQTGHEGKLKDKHPGSSVMIQRINHIIRKASLVFAGSDALAAYAGRLNPDAVRLVPTAYPVPEVVPEQAPTPGKPVTIGWIGGNGTLPYLRLIDAALCAVQQRHPGVTISIMSGRPPEGLQAKTQFTPWSQESEKSWLESIDIGIMPLEDDEWSRGKCAFKLLQYMSHGKPVVASAVGANMEAVIDRRSGFLASSSQQWEQALESLISSPRLRSSMGEESLRHFLATYERQRVQEQMATILQNHPGKKTVS